MVPTTALKLEKTPLVVSKNQKEAPRTHTEPMLYRGLLLALATAHAWNDCAFPDVGYFTVDEGIGISFAYGAAGMNGSLYSGGYYKGHLALIGVTDSGEVLPEPSSTLWGDVQSDVQVRMTHL